MANDTYEFNLDPKSAAAALAGGPRPHPANHYDMVPLLQALGGAKGPDWSGFTHPSTNIEDTRAHNVLQSLGSMAPSLRALNAQGQQQVAQNIEDQFFTPHGQRFARMNIGTLQPAPPFGHKGWPRFAD